MIEHEQVLYEVSDRQREQNGRNRQINPSSTIRAPCGKKDRKINPEKRKEAEQPRHRENIHHRIVRTIEPRFIRTES